MYHSISDFIFSSELILFYFLSHFLLCVLLSNMLPILLVLVLFPFWYFHSVLSWSVSIPCSISIGNLVVHPLQKCSSSKVGETFASTKKKDEKEMESNGIVTYIVETQGENKRICKILNDSTVLSIEMMKQKQSSFYKTNLCRILKSLKNNQKCSVG
jgi:hypothetical protein